MITLGPLDGRYRGTVIPLTAFLPEVALDRARIAIEVERLIFLSQNEVFPGASVVFEADVAYLRAIPQKFGEAEIAEHVAIEAGTKRDVKAVEYLIKRRMEAAPDVVGPNTAFPSLTEMVHALCTSKDVNNLAYTLCIKGTVTDVWFPAALKLHDVLAELAHAHADLPMLSRTYGRTATPTTVGKEMAVFAHRLSRQLRRIASADYLGKINGATGTSGAYVAALPDVDWPALPRTFVEGLGFAWNPLTTQVEPHDWQADLFSDVVHANHIAYNLAADMWAYIPLDYFHQNLAAQGTTGSSTMPHKVNPVRFENAEASLEVSSALFETLAETLAISRLQRDLADSTMQRNIGIAFGHSLLALDNLARGLAGMGPNPQRLAEDLDASWGILGEPIQQAIRTTELGGATGMGNPYERLKELTQGRKVTAEDMCEAVTSLGMPDDVAARLAALTPAGYTGLAARLVGFLDGAAYFSGAGYFAGATQPHPGGAGHPDSVAQPSQAGHATPAEHGGASEPGGHL